MTTEFLHPNVKDITGQTFARLTVVKFSHMHLHKGGTRSAKWVCLCSCGKSLIVSSNSLKTGHTKSCGCIKKGKVSPNRGVFGESAKSAVYIRYRKAAEARKLDFPITREEFLAIAEQNCTYCNAPPRKVITPSTYYGEAYLNGVDRVDSKVGYAVQNCVPCCSTCNYMKQETSVGDFKKQIIEIYNYWATKEDPTG